MDIEVACVARRYKSCIHLIIPSEFSGPFQHGKQYIAKLEKVGE